MSCSKAKEDFVKAMMEEQDKLKDEFMDAAVAKFQEVFLKSGFIETANQMQKRFEKDLKTKTAKRGKGINAVCLDSLFGKVSVSELTVYKLAVENHINKQNSSSPEDEDAGKSNKLDNRRNEADQGQLTSSSDDMDNSDEGHDHVYNESLIEEFIAESRERQFPVDGHKSCEYKE